MTLSISWNKIKQNPLLVTDMTWPLKWGQYRMNFKIQTQSNSTQMKVQVNRVLFFFFSANLWTLNRDLIINQNRKIMPDIHSKI